MELPRTKPWGNVNFGCLPGESIKERTARIEAEEAIQLSDAERNRVRNKTSRFARANRIERQACVCGKPNTHMHHVDYRSWFLIGFLCPKCHNSEHWGRLETPFIVWDLRELAVADRVAFP